MSPMEQSLPVFASVFRKLLADRQLTPTAFAREVGLAQSTVQKWHAGASEPDHTGLRTIAAFFGCSADHLLGIASPPSDLRPGNWLIDTDEYEYLRTTREVDDDDHNWASAIPERFRVVTSSEYQSMRKRLPRERR